MTYAGRRPAALAAAALLLAGALAGCGGGNSSDDTSDATQGAAASASTSASPSSTASTTASASPSTSPSATSEPSATGVPPATGPLITMAGYTINAPDGWQVAGGSDPESNQAYLPSKPIGTLDLRSYEDLGSFGPSYALKQAEQAAKTLLGHPATQEADRTVDGVDMFVLTGSNAAYANYYEFVAVHEGYVADVTLFLNAKLDDPQGFVDAIVDSLHFTTPPA